MDETWVGAGLLLAGFVIGFMVCYLINRVSQELAWHAVVMP